MSKLYRVNQHFPRRAYVAHRPKQFYQVDLMDFSKLGEGYGYIMNCIDVFSRYLTSARISNKDQYSLQDALNECMNKMGGMKHGYLVHEGEEELHFDGKPEYIQCDKESGIYALKDEMQKHGITLYSIPNAYDGKFSAPIVERLNRTFRQYLLEQKHSTRNNWKTILSQAVEKFPEIYNNTVHSFLGTTPKKAFFNENKRITVNNIQTKNANMYKEQPKEPFKLGDTVRVPLPVKGDIKSKYAIKYNPEIFKIAAIKATNPITYKVQKGDDKPITGAYYKQQLIPTIEKVKQQSHICGATLKNGQLCQVKVVHGKHCYRHSN